MTTGDPAKKLHALLKRLRTQYDQPAGMGEPPANSDAREPIVHELVFSMLLWECSTPQARLAYERLLGAMPDLNEVRVCQADEIAEAVGEKYPLSLERSVRLRMSLQDVFDRFGRVTLGPLGSQGKREARAVLESLAGVPHFASHRVTLLSLHGHALPVDERLLSLLHKEGLCAEHSTPEEASGWLERTIHAPEGAGAATLFQAWSDDQGTAPRAAGRAIPTLSAYRESLAPLVGDDESPAPRRRASRSTPKGKPRPPRTGS